MRPARETLKLPNCRSTCRRAGFRQVFGERPKPASPVERRAEGDVRAQFAALKRPLPAVTAAPDTIKLPKTATDAELTMIAGSILLALSLILFVFNRRQIFAR
jgi:Ca-activated chloride channel family protein